MAGNVNLLDCMLIKQYNIDKSGIENPELPNLGDQHEVYQAQRRRTGQNLKQDF